VTERFALRPFVVEERGRPVVLYSKSKGDWQIREGRGYMRGIRFVGVSALVGLAVSFPISAAGAAQPATSRSATVPPGTLRVTLADPAASPGDDFGAAVARSGGGVGATMVVGAYVTNSLAGAAYIYVRSSSGWPTTPTATLEDPAATSGDSFGYSVAVSGNTAVVGAYGTNGAGAAYIYVKGSSGWPTTPTATLADPAATSSDFFGYSVAVSGNTAVVGAWATNSEAGSAYIYVKGSSGWPTAPTATLADPAATSDDSFGTSVAVSGKTAVVGADGTNNGGGAAYFYVRGSSGWPTIPTTTLADPAATSGDFFGLSVAASGNTAVVGADGTADGTNSFAGAAYIYVKGSSGWPTTPTATLADPAATSDDSFGASVAVSGNTAVIGAPNTAGDAGAAYIYVTGSSGWPTTPTATLADPAATSHDVFGGSVAAVSGHTAAVGAYGTNTYAGAAYLYRS
jgi:FG-GAP repeat protein